MKKKRIITIGICTIISLVLIISLFQIMSLTSEEQTKLKNLLGIEEEETKEITLNDVCSENNAVCEEDGITKKITYDCNGVKQEFYTSLTDFTEIENEIKALKKGCEAPQPEEGVPLGTEAIFEEE